MYTHSRSSQLDPSSLTSPYRAASFSRPYPHSHHFLSLIDHFPFEFAFSCVVAVPNAVASCVVSVSNAVASLQVQVS
jgi:hypothetical protein